MGKVKELGLGLRLGYFWSLSSPPIRVIRVRIRVRIGVKGATWMRRLIYRVVSRHKHPRGLGSIHSRQIPPREGNQLTSVTFEVMLSRRRVGVLVCEAAVVRALAASEVAIPWREVQVNQMQQADLSAVKLR